MRDNYINVSSMEFSWNNFSIFSSSFPSPNHSVISGNVINLKEFYAANTALMPYSLSWQHWYIEGVYAEKQLSDHSESCFSLSDRCILNCSFQKGKKKMNNIKIFLLLAVRTDILYIVFQFHFYKPIQCQSKYYQACQNKYHYTSATRVWKQVIFHTVCNVY